ncbi:MAG: hypothetical protein ACXABO_08365 [Promethearchaeota archaeon]|jgi:hypothetical protein
MSKEEEQDEEDSVEDERKKLSDLGVKNTWDILSSEDKKKKEQEKKPAYRGFK